MKQYGSKQHRKETQVRPELINISLKWVNLGLDLSFAHTSAWLIRTSKVEVFGCQFQAPLPCLGDWSELSCLAKLAGDLGRRSAQEGCVQ